MHLDDRGFHRGRGFIRRLQTLGCGTQGARGRCGTEYQSAPAKSWRVNEPVEGVVAKAATISELREPLDERRRVEILRAVFDTIVLDSSGVVGFTLRPPFDAVLKEVGAEDGKRREFEPLVSAIIQHAENLSTEGRIAA